MKISTLSVAAVLFMPLLACAQDLSESEVVAEQVPDAAVASAVKAVAELGKAVVQGKYQMALERMNPKEKERLAKQMGGLKELEEKLKAVPNEMNKQGVRILSCQPQAKPIAYGVEPLYVIDKGEVGGGGADNQKGRWFYSQWLVLVPTVTRFEILHRVEGQPAKWIEIESLGFQVAVSDRNKEDWTFIDGAGLTVAQLCNLYKTLPADIQLPPLQKRQIQN